MWDTFNRKKLTFQETKLPLSYYINLFRKLILDYQIEIDQLKSIQ